MTDRVPGCMDWFVGSANAGNKIGADPRGSHLG